MLTLNAFNWPLSSILKDKFSEIIIHFHFAKAPAKAVLYCTNHYPGRFCLPSLLCSHQHTLFVSKKD